MFHKVIRVIINLVQIIGLDTKVLAEVNIADFVEWLCLNKWNYEINEQKRVRHSGFDFKTRTRAKTLFPLKILKR